MSHAVTAVSVIWLCDLWICSEPHRPPSALDFTAAGWSLNAPLILCGVGEIQSTTTLMMMSDYSVSEELSSSWWSDRIWSITYYSCRFNQPTAYKAAQRSSTFNICSSNMNPEASDVRRKHWRGTFKKLFLTDSHIYTSGRFGTQNFLLIGCWCLQPWNAGNISTAIN